MDLGCRRRVGKGELVAQTEVVGEVHHTGITRKVVEICTKHFSGRLTTTRTLVFELHYLS